MSRMSKTYLRNSYNISTEIDAADKISTILNEYENTEKWRTTLRSYLSTFYSMEQIWFVSIELIRRPGNGEIRHFGLFMLKTMVNTQWPFLCSALKDDIEDTISDLEFVITFDYESLEYWGKIIVDMTKEESSFLECDFYKNALEHFKSSKTCHLSAPLLMTYLKGLKLSTNTSIQKKKELSIKALPMLREILKILQIELEPILNFATPECSQNYEKTSWTCRKNYTRSFHRFDGTNVVQVKSIYDKSKQYLPFLTSCFEWAPLEYLNPSMLIILEGIVTMPFDPVEVMLPRWELKKELVLLALDCLMQFINVSSQSSKKQSQVIKSILQIFLKLSDFFICLAENENFLNIYLRKILKCIELSIINHSLVLERSMPIKYVINGLSTLTFRNCDMEEYKFYLDLWITFFAKMPVVKNITIVNEIYEDSITNFIFRLYPTLQVKYNFTVLEDMLYSYSYAETRQKWLPIQEKTFHVLELATSFYLKPMILRLLDDFCVSSTFILNTSLTTTENTNTIVFEFDPNTQDYLMNLGDSTTLLTLFGKLIEFHDPTQLDVLCTEEIYDKFSSMIALAEYFVKWKLNFPDHETFKLFKVYALETEIVLLKTFIKCLPWLSKFDEEYQLIKHKYNYVKRIMFIAFQTVTDMKLPDAVIYSAGLLLDNLCRLFDISENFELFTTLTKDFCNISLLQLPLKKQLLYMRLIQGYCILAKRCNNSDSEYSNLVTFLFSAVLFLKEGVFDSFTHYRTWIIWILSSQIEYVKDLKEDDKMFVAESLTPIFNICIGICNNDDIDREVLSQLMATFESIFMVFGNSLSSNICTDLGNVLLHRFEEITSVTETAIINNLIIIFKGMVETSWLRVHLKDILHISVHCLVYFSSEEAESELKKLLVELHCDLLVNHSSWFYDESNSCYFSDIMSSFLKILNKDEPTDVLCTVVNCFWRMNKRNLFLTSLSSERYLQLFLYALLEVLGADKIPEAELACHELIYCMVNSAFLEVCEVSFNEPLIYQKVLNEQEIKALIKYNEVAKNLTNFSANFEEFITDYKFNKRVVYQGINVDSIVENYVKERQLKYC